MKNLAISYLRYSSKGQATGDSERRQEELFDKWLAANSNTYEPYHPYRDLGKSGYTGKHLHSEGSLGKLLKQTEEGVFKKGDVLVVEAIDRLSRQVPMAALDLFSRIVGAGLAIITLEDGQRYDYDQLNNNPISLQILIAKIQSAHEYSKRLGDRIRAAHSKKRFDASKGNLKKIVSAPWLKDGEIYEPVAELVRHAVRMYLDGYGTRAIAITLTDLVKSSEESVKKRYKKPIDPRTIKRWFVNPALIGHWKSKGGLIENCFKPLIEYTVWIKIQDELKRRAKNIVSAGAFTNYKISGLILCEHCGSPFMVRVQKPKPTKLAPLGSDAYRSRPSIRYLNCSRYLKSGGCDNNTTWPYQVLEYVYESTINECLFQLAMGLPASKAAEKEINKTKEDIAELELKADRYRELFGEFNDLKSKQSLGLVLASLEKLNNKLDVLLSSENKEKKNLGQEFIGEEYSSLKYPPWDNADAVGQKHILKEAGYTIKLDGKLAFCSYGRLDWELVRRNQSSRTYTLKEVSRINSRKGSEKYLAINEFGKVVAESEILLELSELLDQKKASNTRNAEKTKISHASGVSDADHTGSRDTEFPS